MGNNYRVDKIRETIVINDAGDTVKVMKIRAIGPGETGFTVTVPETEFTPEHVDQVLTERADNIERIRQL